MNTPSNELAPLVAGAALKLRMTQISFADYPEEQRHKYLAEVVEQQAGTVLPDRRHEFLTRLMDEFPVWDAAAKAPAAAPAEPPAETVGTLVARLIQRAQTVTAEQRAELARQLQAADLLPSAPPPCMDAPAPMAGLPRHMQDACQYVMREWELNHLDLVRTLKLVVMFSRYVSSTDAVIWKLWKLIAPRSPVKRSCDLREEITRYASGDKSVPGLEVKADLDNLQNMIMWILAAIGQAGTEVAQSHLAPFAPMAIQTEANKEGGFGLEVRCWKRYTTMAHDLEGDVMDYAFREAIVRRVEQFMKAKAREASPPEARAN